MRMCAICERIGWSDAEQVCTSCGATSQDQGKSDFQFKPETPDEVPPYLEKDQLIKLVALSEIVELEHYAGSLFIMLPEGINPLWLRQEARRLLEAKQ